MPSGNGMTAASVIAGVPPTKTLTRSGTAALERRRMVYANAAMQLIVQADLAIELVLTTRQLDAIHAEIRTRQTGIPDVFGVDLRQRHVGSAVIGPRFELRQLSDRAAAWANTGPRGHASGPHVPGRGQWRASDFQGALPSRVGSVFKPIRCRTWSSVSRKMNRARSSVPNRFETMGNGSRRPAQTARPAPAAIDAPLDLGDLQVGAHFLGQPHQMPGAFQVRHTLLKRAISSCSVGLPCRPQPLPYNKAQRTSLRHMPVIRDASMNVQATTAVVTELESDAIVAGIFTDGILGPMLAELDAATQGLVTRLVARKEITGKQAEVVRLLSPPGLQTGELLVVGLGRPRDVWPGSGRAGRGCGCQAVGRAGSANCVVFCFRRRMG